MNTEELADKLISASLPWHPGHFGQAEARQEVVFDRNGMAVAEMIDRGLAGVKRADFITKAANSHDALRATVEDLMSQVRYLREHLSSKWLNFTGPSTETALAEAQYILALGNDLPINPKGSTR